MAVCYNRLWKLLIDKKMSRTQLRKEAHITSNALAKMGKDEFVRIDTLAKICTVLGCKVDDIMEIIPDSEIAN